jgi:hypothetical protein
MRGVSVKVAVGGPKGRCVAGLLLLSVWLAIPAGADAGTYVINNCPSAGNGNAGPWTVFGESQGAKGTCSGGPGDWIGPEGANMPPTGEGDLAGVQVAVPAGSAITIREAKLWWYVPHQVSGAGTYAIAAVNTGQVGGGGTPLERQADPEELVFPSTTTELTLADYCSNSDAGNGCTFGAGENPNLELFGASLTLFDPGLSSGAVTGGSLAGSGPASGTESLAYNASDGGSGVRYVEVLLDGKSVAKNDYIAECPYQNFAACPANVSGVISWNTGGVADGQHEIALRIVNAGGNSTIVDDHTITIDNPTSVGGASTGLSTSIAIGPGSPAVVRGAPNGMNASDQAKLTARWTSTSKATRTSGYGRADRVSGRLTTATGQPISGALLDVSATAADQGAKAASLVSVRTGPTGAWTLTLPKGISSSALRFAYDSHVDDTVSAATATLTLRVHAGVELRIAPRTTSVGRTISFSGALRGGPIPEGGKQLVLEARSGLGEWIQFRTIGTDAKGAYRASYRFKFPGPVTYRFRVLAPHEADFPFLAGTSNVVDVHER